MCHRSLTPGAMLLLTATAMGQEVVFPTLPHVAASLPPFGNPDSSHHQVYSADLFTPLLAGHQAIRVEQIAFSAASPAHIGDRWNLRIAVRMSHSDKVPGVPPFAGLSVPSSGLNSSDPMKVFFESASFEFSPTSADPNTFEMEFMGTPFNYYPAKGNLLIEILTDGEESMGHQRLRISTCMGGSESSRTYEGRTFSGISIDSAVRTRFTVTPVSPPCYPDCDVSTGFGVMDIFDFLCFGNAFDSGKPYACDCDTLTGLGVCDVFDFLCFGNAFEMGCP